GKGGRGRGDSRGRGALDAAAQSAGEEGPRAARPARSVKVKPDERNEKPRRAIERLGARLDGVRRADMPGQDGTVRNSAYYSIVRAEWPAICAKLEDALARTTW